MVQCAAVCRLRLAVLNVTHGTTCNADYVVLQGFNNKRMSEKQITSRSQGRIFRSNKTSKPSTSKQTLSLPTGALGRHMRYEWST